MCNQTRLIKILIFSFIIIWGIIPLSTVFASNLPLGSSCNSNSDCASGDCEKSAKTDDKGNKQWFCDCVTADDCLANYGPPNDGGEWECSEGADATWDLDYCISSNSKDVRTPIPPKDPSFIDSILDPTVTAKTMSEIDKIIQAPQTKINIPGLKFSTPEQVKEMVKEEGGSTYLYLPFVGEYLAAWYKYVVIFAGIFAVVMIMNHGFGIVVSGGNAEKIQHSKKRMAQAVTGLLLAVGSYALLYAINPELVQFRNLKVLYVAKQELDLPDIFAEPVSSDQLQFPKPVTKPMVPPEGVVPCDSPETYGLVKIPQLKGIKYLKNDNQDYLLPELIEPLKKVGELAATEGYAIGISTACRSLTGQQKLASANPQGLSLGTTAKPGKSPHGFGYAVDVHLLKDGKSLTQAIVGAASSGGQCTIPQQKPEVLNAIKKQSEFFLKAGWVRLTTESWHYEYGTAGKFCRAQCTGFASLCGQTGSDDCPKGVNGCKN